MKFTYAYRTSDGKRHEAEIHAESREVVFSTLRAQGIRPIKVVAADGSKANGAPAPSSVTETPAQPQSRIVLTSLLVLVLALIAVIVISFSKFQSSAPNNDSLTRELLTGSTRRQVFGDAFVIEKGIRTGWSDVFAHEGERFLASFAIPGVPAAQRTSTEDELRAALNRKILPSASDTLEAQQIKAMVEGMKDELRRFVNAGGTIAEYGRRLVQRQEEELKYYNLVKNELDAAAAAQMPQHELLDLWERRNEDLRHMGIRLVPMPE